MDYKSLFELKNLNAFGLGILKKFTKIGDQEEDISPYTRKESIKGKKKIEEILDSLTIDDTFFTSLNMGMSC